MAIKGTSESQLAGLRKLAAVQRYQLRILQVRTRLAREMKAWVCPCLLTLTLTSNSDADLIATLTPPLTLTLHPVRTRVAGWDAREAEEGHAAGQARHECTLAGHATIERAQQAERPPHLARMDSCVARA